MLMEFSPVTTVDFWVRFLPKNTLSHSLENESGKEDLLFFFFFDKRSFSKFYFPFLNVTFIAQDWQPFDNVQFI